MPIGVNKSVNWWQNPHAEEHRDRFYGRYLGFVRDRDDPAKLGRVRIHIPALMPGDYNKQDLWSDWALPVGGSLCPPPIDHPVWVIFEHGIISHPTYEWGCLRGETANDTEAPVAGTGDQDATWKSSSTSSAAGSGPSFSGSIPADPAIAAPPTYGYNKVFQSESGHILELDDSTNGARVRYYHPSGTSILIDPDGSVHIRSVGGVVTDTDGDYVINLGSGSSFKVVYNSGSSLVLGASGFHVTGHQASIVGKVFVKNGEAL